MVGRTVLWDWDRTLWELMLTVGRVCQNWVELRRPSWCQRITCWMCGKSPRNTVALGWEPFTCPQVTAELEGSHFTQSWDCWKIMISSYDCAWPGRNNGLCVKGRRCIAYRYSIEMRDGKARSPRQVNGRVWCELQWEDGALGRKTDQVRGNRILLK